MFYKIVNYLRDTQTELEDALRLEINRDDVKDTKFGRQLLKYLRKRRRFTNRMIKKYC